MIYRITINILAKHTLWNACRTLHAPCVAAVCCLAIIWFQNVRNELWLNSIELQRNGAAVFMFVFFCFRIHGFGIPRSLLDKPLKEHNPKIQGESKPNQCKKIRRNVGSGRASQKSNQIVSGKKQIYQKSHRNSNKKSHRKSM